jgi:GPH family glycoside/pentoside/hexuronide:cation symporter
MLPDVVDLDELTTGKRREGDMYSVFLMFQKIGLGLALAMSSFALGKEKTNIFINVFLNSHSS